MHQLLNCQLTKSFTDLICLYVSLTPSWEMHCLPGSVGSVCTAPQSCPSPAGWRTGAAGLAQRWLWEDEAGASLPPHRLEWDVPHPPPHDPWHPDKHTVLLILSSHQFEIGACSKFYLHPDQRQWFSFTFSFCSFRSTIWVSPDLSEHSFTISLCSESQRWNSWTRSEEAGEKKRINYHIQGQLKITHFKLICLL